MRPYFLGFLIFLYFSETGKGQTHAFDSTKNGSYLFKSHDTLLISGYFKNKLRHKVWTYYNLDGSIHKQMKYKKGKPLWVIYFEKNKVWLKVNRHGKRRVIRACECDGK